MIFKIFLDYFIKGFDEYWHNIPIIFMLHESEWDIENVHLLSISKKILTGKK